MSHMQKLITMMNHSKSLKIFFMLFISVFVFSSCEREPQKLSYRIESDSGCMEESRGHITKKDKAIVYRGNHDEMYIKHINVLYDCKADSITIDARVRDNYIVVRENEYAEDNDCSCPRTISYVIEKIPSGKYIVVVNDDTIGSILIY